jgi:hypothetical protein
MSAGKEGLHSLHVQLFFPMSKLPIDNEFNIKNLSNKGRITYFFILILHSLNALTPSLAVGFSSNE